MVNAILLVLACAAVVVGAALLVVRLSRLG